MTKHDGLVKRCGCPAKRWVRCDHPWWFDFKPKGGKRQRFNLNARSGKPADYVMKYEEAKTLRDDYRSKLRANVGASDVRLTFGDVADLYAKAREDKGTDYTLARLRKLEVPAPGHTTVALERKPIESVTTADVLAAEAAYRKTAKRRAAGGVVGVRKLLQTARHLFNWAIRHGHASSTPFRREGVTMISVKPGRPRKRRLVGDEETRLLAAADPLTKDLIAAVLETGCRGGELRTLQWSEVRDKQVVILPAKAKDREERRVRITATLQKVLDARRNGPDGEPLPPTAYVFGNAVGDPVTKERAGELWRATCKAAKVDGLHFHDLRREFGSRFLEAGNDVHVVRDVLGHTSVTMTNTYLATEDEAQATAFARFEAAGRRRALRAVAGGKA